MSRGIKTSMYAVIGAKLILFMAIAWAIVLAGSTRCPAVDVVLQWDANTEADLAGYKVYYKTGSSELPFDGTGAAEGSAPVDVQNQTSATVSGLDPAQAHFFAVTSYNAAGVESAYSNIVSIPETMSPTAIINYPKDASVVNGTLSVTADASDNVGVTLVKFYVNDVYAGEDTSSPYIYSWDTSELSAGAYTLVAKAYDAAGNEGMSDNITVTVALDTDPPTVSLTSPSNNSIVSGIITLEADAGDDVGVTNVEFFVNGALAAAGNMPPYRYVWDTMSVSDGPCILSARAYDASGHVGQSSNVTITVINDMTAPAMDSFIMPATSTTLTVELTALSATDSVGVTGYLVTESAAKPSATALGWSSAAPDSFTFSGEGVKTAYAWAKDAAGNVSNSLSRTVTITLPDITAPTVSVISPATGATVNGTVMITASASDNTSIIKVEFIVNGTLVGSDTSSPYNCSWKTADLANGSYSVYAKAYDAAGNVGESPKITVTLLSDMKAPSIFVSSPSNGSTVSGMVVVAASASDDVGVGKVEFYLNGELMMTDSSPPYSFNWDTKSATNGGHSLLAKAYDAAGNVGQSATVLVTVFNDTSPPTVFITAPSKNTTVRGSVSVTASASDETGVSKVEFYINGELKFPDTAAPYSFNWDTAVSANGSYVLTAKAYDLAGNAAQSPSVTVRVNNSLKKKGDVNGDGAINIADALLVLGKTLNKSTVSENEKFVSDVFPLDASGNPAGDGVVEIADALLILKYSVGFVRW